MAIDLLNGMAAATAQRMCYLMLLDRITEPS
jgi:hypothetical protein